MVRSKAPPPAPPQTPSALLEAIYTQRRTAPLAILGLAEPIFSPEAQQDSRSTSSQSETPNPSLTPSTLAADLTHYRDLFSKLRFSYLEQVTKEKYLRGIVGDPPILVDAEQNAQLEEKLAVMKTELQAKKRGVERLVEEMEALAREIAERYDGVNLAVTQLEILPGQIEAMEKEVADLQRLLADREGVQEVSDDPRMNMSLEDTERAIEEQKAKRDKFARRIEELEDDLPGRSAECERIHAELGELERRRNEITRLARDAQRLREAGGRDMLEEQGRWYQSSEVVLRGLLGVQA